MSQLSTTAPGEEITLDLGVEGRISVRRVERVDRERTVGSFSKGQRRTIASEFIVESQFPAPTSLILVDQVPVSEIEGVEVELTRACAPKPVIDEDGLCRWTLSIAPGGVRMVIFEFEVTVAKGVGFSIEAIR